MVHSISIYAYALLVLRPRGMFAIKGVNLRVDCGEILCFIAYFEIECSKLGLFHKHMCKINSPILFKFE